MFLRKCLLMMISGTLFHTAAAQKKQNIYFYKNNGKEVFIKDSADFIRVIQEPDSGALYFNLIELYADGKRKTLGTVSSFLPRLKYEGQLINYYPSGKKLRIANYQNNQLKGPAYVYFENGKLHKTFELKVLAPEKNKPYTRWADTLVTYLADTAGLVMVKNGNGHVSVQVASFNGALVEGDYKDGVKHGLWTMKSNDGVCSYKEEYVNGEFVSGESEKAGVISTYKMIDELPAMKGGIENFYSYLKRNIRYPADAQRQNIQGKVFLSFTVEHDGTLTNIKVERGLYPSMDEEATRILEMSPRWIPGKQHGFPVRVKYNIPISFSLNHSIAMPQPANRFNHPPRF